LDQSQAKASATRNIVGFWQVGLAAILIAGCVLRLIWGSDIEYKGDEAWLFASTQLPMSQVFASLGAPSSVWLLNPGGSIWVFAVLAKLFGAHDPVALARCVQVLNIFAIGMLVWFALRIIPLRDREAWLWAAAIAAVNPIAVLLQRKIWQPSLLPIFSVLMIAAWMRRSRWWGAFSWGLVGALAGQIHLSGFFFTAGFVLWSALFDRERVRWISLGLGVSVGMLPLIPWFSYLLPHLMTGGVLPVRVHHILELKFWLRWFTEPFGFGLRYPLGGDFQDFIGYPIVFSARTYLVALLHAAALLIALTMVTRAGLTVGRNRSQWSEFFIGRDSETAFAQNAALWGFGILMTLSGLPIHRHYLIVAFPLEFLWVSRLALTGANHNRDGVETGRVLLAGLCVVQLLLSSAFLSYIHVNHGAPNGNYGIAYSAQQRPG
jgi:hypothetical protein